MTTHNFNIGDTVVYIGHLFPKYHGKKFEIGALKDDYVQLLDKDEPYELADGTIDYLQFMVSYDAIKQPGARSNKKRV